MKWLLVVLCLACGCTARPSAEGEDSKSETAANANKSAKRLRASVDQPHEDLIVWTQPSQPLTSDNIEVRIKTVSIGTVPLKNFGDSESRDEMLMIGLEIKNVNPNKVVQYSGWGKEAEFGGTGRAALKDDAGNTYKRVRFGIGSHVVGQADDGESISPAKTIADVVVFEPPIHDFKYLLFELPPQSIGEDTLRFKIPREFITKSPSH